MDFYRRVEIVCREIPYGRVATYGQIALLCGKPRNARQVGYALRCRVSGEAIPAHRVVSANGFLSGAGAFEKPDTQRKRLAEEKVTVNEEGMVDLKKYGWYNTMDDALRLKAAFERQDI